MYKLLTYETTAKFRQEFDTHYSYANLRQVRVVSSIIFLVALAFHVFTFIFKDRTIELNYYNELSAVLWIHVFGSIFFFLISSFALKTENSRKLLRKCISVLFIIYMLTMSLAVSHVLSMHNARNMLTMYFIGITTVSLFFAIEYRILLCITFYITVLYLAIMVYPGMPLQQRTLSELGAVILSIVLITFSRYSYFSKSITFVKIKELEEKNKEVQHLNRQKGEILSFVAHDLRAPLNNIAALSNLMLLDSGNNNQQAKMVLNSTVQAQNIINDLLEAAKQNTHNLPTEVINVKLFVDRVIEKWKTNTDRTIMLDIADNNITLKANPSKLERVIDNLISNAFKFSSIHKPINISISNNNDIINIKVVDAGIGIPQHLQAHIFEQFSKAGRDGLQGEKSIGLGLHISHKIIEQHQGELYVESKESEGTTFTIRLPLNSA